MILSKPLTTAKSSVLCVKWVKSLWESGKIMSINALKTTTTSAMPKCINWGWEDQGTYWITEPVSTGTEFPHRRLHHRQDALHLEQGAPWCYHQRSQQHGSKTWTTVITVLKDLFRNEHLKQDASQFSKFKWSIKRWNRHDKWNMRTG